MMIKSPGHGERKWKPAISKTARYGTSGLEQLLPQVPRLNRMQPKLSRQDNRRRKVFEMPPDYICPKCKFDSTDCTYCLDTDILAIPCGELDGELNGECLSSVLTPEVRREIVIAVKKESSVRKESDLCLAFIR